MAAGAADHVWTLQETAALLDWSRDVNVTVPVTVTVVFLAVVPTGL
jgi:hypothetical protein